MSPVTFPEPLGLTGTHTHTDNKHTHTDTHTHKTWRHISMLKHTRKYTQQDDDDDNNGAGDEASSSRCDVLVALKTNRHFHLSV